MRYSGKDESGKLKPLDHNGYSTFFRQVHTSLNLRIAASDRIEILDKRPVIADIDDRKVVRAKLRNQAINPDGLGRLKNLLSGFSLKLGYFLPVFLVFISTVPAFFLFTSASVFP